MTRFRGDFPARILRSLMVNMVLFHIVGCGMPLGKVEAPERQAKAGSQTKESPTLPQRKLNHILEGLQSADAKVRESSRQELIHLSNKVEKVSLKDGLRALRAASQPFPFKSSDSNELSACLVRIAASMPREEYTSVIAASFEKYSEKAKRWALSILAQLESREAAVAYMEIIRRHADTGGISELVIGPLVQKPRHADVWFPELLRYAKNAKLAPDVYQLCLAYCNARLLSPPIVAPFSGQVLDTYRSLAARLRSAQQSQGVSWMWEEKYVNDRNQGGLILDLMGHFANEEMDGELWNALHFSDPSLQYFAISSLLRRGKLPDTKAINEVAASAEMRNWLYAELQKHGKLSLYPERYLTQAALAESDMVQWLTFPTELGRAPDEIELMKVVPIDTRLRNGIYDYYLFRFRTHEPHWAAKKGWLAGISGPFKRADSPTTTALGHTFSTFDPWDEKAPEKHVGDLLELMKRWRTYHMSSERRTR
jgi:hypothetical protein